MNKLVDVQIFLPMHEPAHFFLLVVDVNLMTISVWDTLGKGQTIEYYSNVIDLQVRNSNYFKCQFGSATS